MFFVTDKTKVLEKMTLFGTRDYEQFKPAPRKPCEKRVAKLMQSIKKKDLLIRFPIVVSDDMTIIDGNHRFEAAKRLGVLIYYRFYIYERQD